MFHKIRTVSASPKALRWLAESEHARVVHLFPQALNLANQRDRVLSVVVPSVGNGPFSLVIDQEEIAGIDGADAQVLIEENSLIVGQLSITTDSGHVWQPVPAWQDVQASIFPVLVRLAETQLSDRQGGFRDVFYAGDSRKALGYPFLERLAANGLNFLQALAADDPEALQLHAGRLVGLGGGLTPAGDDFLMGAMYALRMTRPNESVEAISELILRTAVGRTTLLSQAWLEAATCGEAGEKWHVLLAAAGAQDEALIIAAVTEILNTGETSGADALTGFVQVLKQEGMQ